MRRLGLVLGCLCGAAMIAVAAPSSEAIRDAAQRVLSSGEYQTQWPRERINDSPFFQRREHERNRQPSEEFSEDVQRSNPWPGIGRALFWILALGLVAWVLVATTLAVGRHKARQNVRQPGATIAPARPTSPTPVPAYQRFATAGHFDRALHAVYLHALHGIGVVNDSWTGREILRNVELAAKAHAALGELTRVVERSFFGSDTVHETDYRAALDLLPQITRDVTP